MFQTNLIQPYFYLTFFGFLSILVSAAEDETFSVYLWPRDLAGECPSGTGIPQDRCLAASRALDLGDRSIENDQNYGGNLRVGSASTMPCGCFIWEKVQNNEYVFIYTIKPSGPCGTTYVDGSHDEHSYILCTAQPPSPDYEVSSIHLWPRDLNTRCPTGNAISQADCLKMGKALVPYDMPLRSTSLYLENWNHRPCGCYIWSVTPDSNYKISYSDRTENCASSPISDPSKYWRNICDAPPPCFLLDTCNA